MRVGSLFTGIGGFDLGFERAGMSIAWQSEIDPYACAVLRKHWPDVPNLGDIRAIRHPPTVDVLCGGFPCQDISVAGKGAGIEGERSGLWREYARIIGEVRPRLVVVENVSALLGRGLGRVLGDLAALGYDAEWHCISAADVGAPHIRDRLWIIAYADELADGQQYNHAPTRHDVSRACFVLADAIRDGLERQRDGHDAGQAPEHVARRTPAGTSPANTADADSQWQLQPQGRECDEWRRPGDGGWWRVEPDVGRVAHGVPARAHRLRCLGNAIVPQIAEIIGTAIVRAERRA